MATTFGLLGGSLHNPSASIDDAFALYNHGHILFLLQQGRHEQALKLYQEQIQAYGQHDFDLLHQIGIRILDYGFRLRDPESQILSLFGASVSAHEDVYYILEESLKSRYPGIQFVALGALARFQNDRADRAILHALGSSEIEVRYEAIRQLCEKRHPQAIAQLESLMYKTPKAYMPIYPPLFAMMGDSHSTRILRKLLNQSPEEVRLSVILSISKYKRDDFLPQLREQSFQFPFTLQEACAYAFGDLKDDTSIPILKKFTLSQYSSVALAAHVALYHLGHEESIQAIEQAAQREDLFAISALGNISNHSEVLLELLKRPNLQIRLNALIALLQQHCSSALDLIEEVFFQDKKDIAFIPHYSPGKVFKAWKVITSAHLLLKDDIKSYLENLKLKEVLLEKVRMLSPSHFIALVDQIFSKQQNDLIPRATELIEELETTEAIHCLKQHQQQLGAPLVRHYCNLALYRLQERGPYADSLRRWIKTQSQTALICFQHFNPWEADKSSYSLTPEATSKLLIETFEAFAKKQDEEGIEVLIDAIANGNSKNKYALAGLLLRATQ